MQSYFATAELMGITTLKDFYTLGRVEVDESIKNKIDSLEREIDNLVYEIYALTQKEIEIVEEHFKE